MYQKQAIYDEDIPAILGSPGCSLKPQNVFVQKVSPPSLTQNKKENPLLENLFLKKFSEVSVLPIETKEKIDCLEQYPFIASLNKFYNRENNINCKVKVVQKSKKNEFGFNLTNEIPEHIYLEMQHNLLATNKPSCYLVVGFLYEDDKALITRSLTCLGFNKTYDIYKNVLDYHFYKINKNEKVQSELVRVEKEFWEQNVLKQNCPKWDMKFDFFSLFPQGFLKGY